MRVRLGPVEDARVSVANRAQAARLQALLLEATRVQIAVCKRHKLPRWKQDLVRYEQDLVRYAAQAAQQKEED